MKRISHIFEKIIEPENIKCAILKSSLGKRNRKPVKKVLNDIDKYVNIIRNLLLNNEYTVSKYEKEYKIERGKTRELNKLPYFPDRIIQHAIMLQLESHFIKKLCYHSCASIPGAGIRRAHKLTKKYAKEYDYCFKFDIKTFYDTIDHDLLKKKFLSFSKDPKLNDLVFKIIDSFESESGKGIPIGSYISQYLANFYLDEFDRLLKERFHLKVVRYMDDVCVFENDKPKLHEIKNFILANINSLTKQNLKHNYQIFCVAKRGVDFVGYRFFKDYILLRKKNTKSFKHIYKRIKRKCPKNISQRDIGAIFAYYGKFNDFNSYNFKQKYFVSLKINIFTKEPKLLKHFLAA